jgi:hypothetical protein
MRHLLKSFQTHYGHRGTHFYDDEDCYFLAWSEVLQFLNTLPDAAEDVFSEKLTDILCNYDPENEFLAVYQKGKTISVELYTSSNKSVKSI